VEIDAEGEGRECTMSTITHGSTNVFADLGYADSAERQTKTRLTLAVNELLKTHKLKQREIASLLAIPQPKVSALKNYRLDQFSVERLMEFLTALNQDVEIIIRPRANAGGVGHISVLSVQQLACWVDAAIHVHRHTSHIPSMVHVKVESTLKKAKGKT